MNFRSRLIAVTGSALILASSITMGAAQTVSLPTDDQGTGNATVEITRNDTENYLAVSISGASFGQHKYNLADRSNVTESDGLTITAVDYRGTGAGWHVNLDATDFNRTVPAAPAASFAIGNLGLTAPSVTGVQIPADDTAATTGITGMAVAAVPETGAGTTNVFYAPVGKGEGVYALDVTGQLTIPGGTLAGQYTSVVSVEIASGPQ